MIYQYTSVKQPYHEIICLLTLVEILFHSICQDCAQ